MELKNKREREIWKNGYEMGVKSNFRDNMIAIEIGNAILNALDKRYTFQNEED